MSQNKRKGLSKIDTFSLKLVSPILLEASDYGPLYLISAPINVHIWWPEWKWSPVSAKPADWLAWHNENVVWEPPLIRREHGREVYKGDQGYQQMWPTKVPRATELLWVSASGISPFLFNLHFKSPAPFKSCLPTWIPPMPQVMAQRVKTHRRMQCSPLLANSCSVQLYLQISHLIYDLISNSITAATSWRRCKADRLVHHIWGNVRKA